jgi:CBS domain-containing protein
VICRAFDAGGSAATAGFALTIVCAVAAAAPAAAFASSTVAWGTTRSAPAGTLAELFGVAAASSADVLAVGGFNPGEPPTVEERTLAGTVECLIAWVTMARTPLDDATQLSAADVIHKRFSALPADSTVAQVRDWFATSSHRKIAVLANQRRYAGSLTREDLDREPDPHRAAADLARPGPTVTPETPALAAHKLAIATPALRVPVVDHDGTLIGVVGVTDDLAGFCGTS